MNQVFCVSGGGKGTAPFLTTQGLRAFIEAEYGIFKAYVKHLVLLLLEHTEGNPPGQGLHDCATLKNRFKCLALGLQLVDPQMKQNHAICLSMLRTFRGGCSYPLFSQFDSLFDSAKPAFAESRFGSVRRSRPRYSLFAVRFGLLDWPNPGR